ncbi:hypothetical protein [Streptomyces cahuitamycinicus]|uniref:hypothetical protein n=1 Tax=Streptomyces cahuitamycinicus TaxID=2070367 RepID=UPI000C9BA609|nr:hypothetical protein [Streptomyces cahuitamycinicus]
MPTGDGGQLLLEPGENVTARFRRISSPHGCGRDRGVGALSHPHTPVFSFDVGYEQLHRSVTLRR